MGKCQLQSSKEPWHELNQQLAAYSVILSVRLPCVVRTSREERESTQTQLVTNSPVILSFTSLNSIQQRKGLGNLLLLLLLLVSTVATTIISTSTLAISAPVISTSTFTVSTIISASPSAATTSTSVFPISTSVVS